MEETNTQRYENTSIDQSIVNVFLNCSESAAVVRAWLTGNIGGSCVAEYRTFSEAFNLLFLLSSSKKTNMAIKKELKLKVEKALDTAYDGTEIAKSRMIKLFEEYKDELFRVGILK